VPVGQNQGGLGTLVTGCFHEQVLVRLLVDQLHRVVASTEGFGAGEFDIMGLSHLIEDDLELWLHELG
jgi:hypothetical protein